MAEFIDFDGVDTLGDHHALGPSSYTFLAMCPGFAGKSTSGTLAIRGTAAHAIGAARLLGIDPPTPTEEEKKVVERSDYDAGVWYAEQVKAMSAGCKLNVESKVQMNPDEINIPDCMKDVFGTVDAWWEDEFGELHVCDFKTFDRGEKDHSPQMEGYALLICSHEQKYKAKPIHLHVAAGGIEKVLSYIVSYNDALRHVSAILNRAMDQGAERSPCAACQYCRHSMTCTGVNPIVAAVNDTSVWSGLSMAAKKVVVDAIKPLIKSFDEDLKEHWKTHETLEDKEAGILYQRTKRNPSAVCKSVAALGEFLGTQGVSAERFLEKICSVSRTACESVLVEANPALTKAAAKTLLNSYFAVPAGAKPSYSGKRVK